MKRSSSHEKKPYRQASYTQIPIAEFVRLLLTKMAGREIRTGSFDLSPAKLATFLVVDYAGDLTFAQPVVRTPIRQLQPFPIQRSLGWTEMQFVDAGGSEPLGPFLMLDLRHHQNQQRIFVESVALSQKFDAAFPRVILATSSEPLPNWVGVERAQCWQIRDCTSMEDLSTTLRSFLRLCPLFTDGTAEMARG